MSRMSDYVVWRVDKFKDTPQAYDVLTDYVVTHRDELGSEYSMEKYADEEQKRSRLVSRGGPGVRGSSGRYMAALKRTEESVNET